MPLSQTHSTSIFRPCSENNKRLPMESKPFQVRTTALACGDVLTRGSTSETIQMHAAPIFSAVSCREKLLKWVFSVIGCCGGCVVRSLVGCGRGERVDRITSNVEGRRTALVRLRIYQIYRFSIRVAEEGQCPVSAAETVAAGTASPETQLVTRTPGIRRGLKGFWNDGGDRGPIHVQRLCGQEGDVVTVQRRGCLCENNVEVL